MKEVRTLRQDSSEDVTEAELKELLRLGAVPLLPLPLPRRPAQPGSKGSRSRQRFTEKMNLWRATVKYIHALNSLHANMSQLPQRRRPPRHPSAAQVQAITRAFRHCRPVLCARRLLRMTGAQAALSILKTAPSDGYLAVSKASQVPFVAARVVEPARGSPVVSMLDALPETESAFYAVEENVLLRGGYSETLKREIEDQYSFLGGKQSEWVEYLCREDYDQDLWSFRRPEEVAAYAGVSAVPKKNGVDLRKLIMACAANYMWTDVTKRFDHGMGGAAAISHLVSWTAGLSVAVIDQSNAFTAVRTPGWMHRYFGCPPVQAGAVWHRLEESLREQISPKDMVVPCYTRLPMGSSHSVHILMTVNMERAGRVLTSRWRPTAETPTEIPELADEEVYKEATPVETTSC